MPAHAARRTHAAPHPHARLLGRGRVRALAFAAAVVGGTSFVAGPATAHESPAPARPTVSLASPLGPLAQTDPVDAFQTMLDEAREAAKAQQELEHRRAVAAAAHKRERERAAKVRASRAALRSTVVRPVAGGYRLTARFGDSSSRWGSGRHTGLDFACSLGTPVHAVASGVVTSAGYSGAYGNRVEIRHADGTVTTYNHLSRIDVHGGSVKAGEVIGRVGTTGNTTGAHLHFEVMRGETSVDPEHWLAARYVSF